MWCDDEVIGDGVCGGGVGCVCVKDWVCGCEEMIDVVDDVWNGDVWMWKICVECVCGVMRMIRWGVFERVGDVVVVFGGGVCGVWWWGECCVDYGGWCVMGFVVDVVEWFGEICGAVVGRLDRDVVVGVRRLRRDDEIVLWLVVWVKECVGIEFDDII